MGGGGLILVGLEGNIPVYSCVTVLWYAGLTAQDRPQHMRMLCLRLFVSKHVCVCMCGLYGFVSACVFVCMRVCI